ncbi:hypothetical protein PS2_026024 [Malus domestica]
MNSWKFLQRAVGLIFEGGFERIFKEPLGLDLEDEQLMNDERFLQGPSRLGLDEQRMSGFVDVVDPKGPLGLDP